MNLYINRKIALLIFSLLISIVLLVGCTTPGPVPINHHPVITSFPITLATVNEAYVYNVDATDPDGDTLTYSLTMSPAGMTINSSTGLINWTPTSTGDYDVIVEVSDNGYPVESTNQNFTIHVGQVSTNQAPNITSTPITLATVNQPYAYNVDATDPDGDTLTYSLSTKPAGMTINSSTGLINWTPASTGDYNVIVEVSDNGYPVLSTTQSFTIHVGEAPINQAPVITSTPITTATVDQTYVYNVNATDPNGDTLTYSLTTKPAGMTIKSWNGLINWTPSATQIGNNDVTVKVSDGDLTDTQSFTITVEGEGVTPNLKLTPSSQTVTQGSQATINVVAEDITDLKGASITLNFDASKLEYSSSTAGSFIPNATLMANSTNGSVTLDIAGLGASGYHSGMGTGTIIIVKFDTIATGNTNITFGATILRDKDNNTITHTKSSGCSVTINEE